MKLSVIIVTRNRRERLLENLRYLKGYLGGESGRESSGLRPLVERGEGDAGTGGTACGRSTGETPVPLGRWDRWGGWEIVVVDNGSEDGTVEAVRAEHADVKVVANASNRGTAARNQGFAVAEGAYYLLVDDDSYPVGETVAASLAHLDAHVDCGAVEGRCVLADGTAEANALPGVMLSGAAVVRAKAIAEVGGFPWEFVRQAEEYDLSLRMWDAGWRIARLEALEYRHDKVASATRTPAVVCKMDLRNNLIIAERYLPRPFRRAYRRDWLRRYAALARWAGCGQVVGEAVREARRIIAADRASGGRRPVRWERLEPVFQIDHHARRVKQWAEAEGVRRVVLIDHAKNLYAAWRGCAAAGLEVVAVVDDHPAYAGMRYRGTPIVGKEQWLTGAVGGTRAGGPPHPTSPPRGRGVGREEAVDGVRGVGEAAAFGRSLKGVWEGRAETGKTACGRSTGETPVPLGSPDRRGQVGGVGAVVANVNPAQVGARVAAVEAWFDGPMLALAGREGERWGKQRPAAVR